MTTQVAIDRSSLSLSDLTIAVSGNGTYVIDQGGLGRPGKTSRETLATASPFVHGQTVTAVVLEDSSLPLVVRVNAATSSALDTAVTALETALRQFTYTVTVTVDGVAKVWTGRPAAIGTVDGLQTYARVAEFYEILTVTIPVYPVAS